MAEFHSYEPHLTRVCQTLQPRLAFEWGPGRSTELILAHSSADIFALEHDENFYQTLVKQFAGNPRVNLVHRPTGIPYGGSQEYATYPLYLDRLFDLIVIDGRQRCDCLTVAALVLEPNGIVLLHDSERPNYHAGYRFFESVEDLDGTTLLRKSKLRLDGSGGSEFRM